MAELAQQEVEALRNELCTERIMRCDLRANLVDSSLEITTLKKRIQELENECQLVLVERPAASSRSLLDRAVRFVTCSTTNSPVPSGPSERNSLTRKSKRNAPQEESTTALEEEEEMKAKEKDVLWSFSRFCF